MLLCCEPVITGHCLLAAPNALEVHYEEPVEKLWRPFRREVTHCELFVSVTALVAASSDFFRHYTTQPEKVLSLIGAKPSLSL